MKKLHLDLDSLSVDSFTTGKGVSIRGTVNGEQQLTAYTYCPPCGTAGTGTNCYTETQAPQATCGGGPGSTCGPKTE